MRVRKVQVTPNYCMKYQYLFYHYAWPNHLTSAVHSVTLNLANFSKVAK